MFTKPYGTYSIYSIKKWIALLFVLTLLFSGRSFASSGSSNANGNWNNPSTWLFNGTPRVPMCGDSVFIPSGLTVTVNNQQSYTACVIPMYIEVSGILQFTNGNKLDLPCGSIVVINAGGLLKKVTAGGGNSTLISICNVVEWNAGDGDLPGPAVLGGSLPVSLLSFSASLNDRKTVDVNWATASEVNNDYFIVQRSTNNLSYADVVSVEGAHNSNQIVNYSITDELPAEGVSYYRLCQVDFDGTRTYYHPVAVRIGENLNVLVYPNPVSEDLWIEVPSSAHATISDIYGKIISEQTLTKGISSTDVKALAGGIYTLRILSGGETTVRKFVVQK